MPNHIRNRVTLHCSSPALDNIIKRFGEIRQGFLMFPSFKKVIPPPNDPAYRDEPSQDVARHSPNWWYTWNTKNWGSKWGGYDYKNPSVNVFEFDTAWSNCLPIIRKISEAFDDVEIHYAYADEDTGSNCGKYIFVAGVEIAAQRPANQSNEAYELAFELRPDIASKYELVDGKYEYKEDE